MDKAKAIELLGGSIAAAAKAVGISYQAVDKWPDTLSRKVTDRVQAALYRKSLAAKRPKVSSRPTEEAQEA